MPRRGGPTTQPFNVRLATTGEVIEVPVGTTILEAMRAKGHDVPSSCESGTCGTCRTKLLAGEADHRDLVLTESERGSQIMICVSRANSPELVDRTLSANVLTAASGWASPVSAAHSP